MEAEAVEAKYIYQVTLGGSGPLPVKTEAEARKFYRFLFHIGYLT